MKFNSKCILIVAILFSQVITAQFYVGVQSGLSEIQSDVDGIIADKKMGGSVKAGYIYSVTKNIGIGAGLEFSQYKQEISSSLSSLTNYEVDASTSAFVYTVTVDNYNEKQTLQAIQIPLFVEFKSSMSKGVDFGFRVGGKYFLPLSYKISATADYVSGTAYYPGVNLTITDLPEYGFGTQSNYSATGEYQTKGIFMSSFEVGFTFDIGKKNSLYTALFLEKGFGTILDQDSKESFIGYNPTSIEARKLNGLYSTDKNADVLPVAWGLTLGWNFN
ncbi:hypothetical protein ACEN2I_19655 [Flavobacterium sp. W22_SRS_FK3]|uniref:hypothetical protein n=1 Tax=Flavobacterium sp. W22_SRS_FK3 TaxID=3240275 RepID=UPI003F90943A